MAVRSRSRVATRALPKPARPPRRWLLLVHLLPAMPSNLRVRTWRRLQQLGAIAVKQSVYVLPDSPGAREDFEWLKSEIEAAGGEATVFAADSVDAWSDDALAEEFRRARQSAYTELAGEVEKTLARWRRRKSSKARQPSSAGKVLDVLRQRLTAIEQVDFFGSAGRDRVLALLEQMERASIGSPSARVAAATPTDPGSYQRRLWVTRPRPGVDRMASAWLIRRFIDSEARFGFVADAQSAPADAVAFDMFGVEFTHYGEQCTFERLSATFSISDASVARIATIVHDLDLKDSRFGAPEAPTVGAVIEGLQLAYESDGQLLENGITLFESLYRSFARAIRPVGARPVAAVRRPRARRKSAVRTR
jgi:hypothetical protein